MKEGQFSGNLIPQITRLEHSFRVIDVIDDYESQFSEMQEELDHLRKETESHNSSYVGSYGEPAADSEEVSQSADSSTTVSSDAAPTDPLKGDGGKWIKDGEAVTLSENKYQAVEEKLLVSHICKLLCYKHFSLAGDVIICNKIPMHRGNY